MIHDNGSSDTEGAGPRPGPATGPTPMSVVAPRLAMVTFGTLFAMNLLDYTDRWILSAVLPEVQRDLRIDEYQAGWLFTFFLISYSIFSPIMGYAGDRFKRTRLLAIGVGLWSVATIGSGLATRYEHMVLARSLLGIGEATYGVIAPTILLDIFSRDSRSRLLSAFYLAMPLGGALGLALGSAISKAASWQMAFFVVGAPGLIAALVALFLPEPVRGTSEGIDTEKLLAHQRVGPSLADYVDMMVNSSYTYSVLGMAFYTFAIGGIVPWMPSFLTVTKGIESVRAGSLLGVTTLFAAIIGMTVGGWLADRLAKTNPRALFLVPGLALLGSVPFVLVAVYAEGELWIFGSIFLAEMLMFVNTGPCNAVIANVVTPNMRAAAYAVSTAAVHVLGDFWSPPLMGWVARTFGQADAMSTPFGEALAAIGATPSAREGLDPTNLTAAMLVPVPALALAGIVLLAGARHLPREMALMRAKLRAAPRPAAVAG